MNLRINERHAVVFSLWDKPQSHYDTPFYYKKHMDVGPIFPDRQFNDMAKQFMTATFKEWLEKK